MKTEQKFNPAANHIISHCGNLKSGEKCLVIGDYKTEKLAQLLYDVSYEISKDISLEIIAPHSMHGQEPSEELALKMLESSLIICITSMSMANTEARARASEKGARYLSLPDYSDEVISSEALMKDFKSLSNIADSISEKLTNGSQIRIITEAGTDLTASIEGRSGIAAPGWCYGPGTIASPPDSEVNIAPVERTASGRLIVDGSIPEPTLGLIENPLLFIIEDGEIKSIEKMSHSSKVCISGASIDDVKKVLENTSFSEVRMLGEIGIGLNDKAKLCGRMLEDEGCAGTAHFGFGSNIGIGGIINVPFHLDHVIKNAHVIIDGEELKWTLETL